MEGAEELLENLYGRYQMYLVTNGTLSVQKGRLKSASISHYFEDIFISEELGYNKPGIEYFNCAFPGFLISGKKPPLLSVTA